MKNFTATCLSDKILTRKVNKQTKWCLRPLFYCVAFSFCYFLTFSGRNLISRADGSRILLECQSESSHKISQLRRLFNEWIRLGLPALNCCFKKAFKPIVVLALPATAISWTIFQFKLPQIFPTTVEQIKLWLWVLKHI